MDRNRYRSDPDRYEYRLTEAGKDLYPAILALLRWGDRHLAPARKGSATSVAPSPLRHRCGTQARLLGVRPGASGRGRGGEARAGGSDEGDGAVSRCLGKVWRYRSASSCSSRLAST